MQSNILKHVPWPNMQINCGMREGCWGLLYIDLDCFNKGYLLSIIDIIFFTIFKIQKGILFSLGKQLRSRSETLTAKRPLQGRERLSSFLTSKIKKLGSCGHFWKKNFSELLLHIELFNMPRLLFDNIKVNKGNSYHYMIQGVKLEEF